jgi:hypothetical protein
MGDGSCSRASQYPGAAPPGRPAPPVRDGGLARFARDARAAKAAPQWLREPLGERVATRPQSVVRSATAGVPRLGPSPI